MSIETKRLEYRRKQPGQEAADGSTPHYPRILDPLQNAPGRNRTEQNWCDDEDFMPTTHAPEPTIRSEEHTSELQSLMRSSYAVFCLKKKTQKKKQRQNMNREQDT